MKLTAEDKPQSNPYSKDLIKEIKYEYARIMNKLVFDSVVNKVGESILPKDFVMPPKKKPPHATL